MIEKQIINTTPHRSPNPDPMFTRMWNVFVGNLVERPNFHIGYLAQLEILCDLYREYHTYSAALELAGTTYWTDGGRNGPQLKVHPHVAQLNRIRVDIVSYSKMLGLVLVKDNGVTEEKDDWD